MDHSHKMGFKANEAEAQMLRAHKTGDENIRTRLKKILAAGVEESKALGEITGSDSKFSTRRLNTEASFTAVQGTVVDIMPLRDPGGGFLRLPLELRSWIYNDVLQDYFVTPDIERDRFYPACAAHEDTNRPTSGFQNSRQDLPAGWHIYPRFGQTCRLISDELQIAIWKDFKVLFSRWRGGTAMDLFRKTSVAMNSAILHCEIDICKDIRDAYLNAYDTPIIARQRTVEILEEIIASLPQVKDLRLNVEFPHSVLGPAPQSKWSPDYISALATAFGAIRRPEKLIINIDYDLPFESDYGWDDSSHKSAMSFIEMLKKRIRDGDIEVMARHPDDITPAMFSKRYGALRLEILNKSLVATQMGTASTVTREDGDIAS